MSIPTRAIRSRGTVPETIVANLSPDMSIHGLLAADFLINPSKTPYWAEILPILADFEDSLPFFWPAKLQELLPTGAKNLLTKQQDMFHQDWQRFNNGFPTTTMQDYLYSWFVVSTRAFYYETPETLAYPWHDRLALLPVADLFNHSTTGCSVSFSATGYTITADREYSEGDELSTSYGNHSNDFLLAEYGFVLTDNERDGVCLDAQILSRLNAKQKAHLQRHCLLGDFMLQSQSRVCDRTWVALQLICGAVTEIELDELINGKEDPGNPPAAAKKLLLSILAEFLEEIGKYRQKILACNLGSQAKQSLLLHRWEQIDELVRSAISLN